jgi:hypothetical protein
VRGGKLHCLSVTYSNSGRETTEIRLETDFSSTRGRAPMQRSWKALDRVEHFIQNRAIPPTYETMHHSFTRRHEFFKGRGSWNRPEREPAEDKTTGSGSAGCGPDYGNRRDLVRRPERAPSGSCRIRADADFYSRSHVHSCLGVNTNEKSSAKGYSSTNFDDGRRCGGRLYTRLRLLRRK